MMWPAESPPVCKATFSHKVLGGWVVGVPLPPPPTPTFLERESGCPFSWLSSLPRTPRAAQFPGRCARPASVSRSDDLLLKGSTILAASTWRVSQTRGAGGPPAPGLFFSQHCASLAAPGASLGLLFWRGFLPHEGPGCMRGLGELGEPAAGLGRLGPQW